MSDMHTPNGIAFDSSGDTFIVDSDNNVVDEVNPLGALSIVAGTGKAGAPTPGPATSSDLNGPGGIAVDGHGDILIGDSSNNVVEKVTPSGILSIVAGTGRAGAPTPGPATSSDLHGLNQIAVDPGGDLFIADTVNNVVEKVTPSGILSIIAGTGKAGAPTPGPATSSDLDYPGGIAIDSSGDAVIGDFGNDVVEKVTPTGNLSIVAGVGKPTKPTPGPATSSALSGPAFVAVDSSDNLYIADYGNNEIERVTTAGLLSVIVGTGKAGTPNPGLSAASPLDRPVGVAVDRVGNVYIGDSGNNVVEKVTVPAPSTPTISNIPSSEPVGAAFDPRVSTSGDGVTSVTSSTTDVCVVSGHSIAFVAAGICRLTAHVAIGAAFGAADGVYQSVVVEAVSSAACASSPGYWIAQASGQVTPFGSAPDYGSLLSLRIIPSKPIVGIAATADCKGYWLVAADGGLFAFGDATFYGSMGGAPLNEPVVGMTATQQGGYYEVASDGGLFAFGPGATFAGSMGGHLLAKPVVGVSATPQGGYFEVASDGGLFAFGPGATFAGSMGGKQLNEPVVGMAVNPTGGYYEVASDGGIFTFGAPFHGSAGCLRLTGSVVAMVVAADTSGVGGGTACGFTGAQPPGGYQFVARDGGVFGFGNAIYAGSLAGKGITDVVGLVNS